MFQLTPEEAFTNTYDQAVAIQSDGIFLGSYWMSFVFINQAVCEFHSPSAYNYSRFHDSKPGNGVSQTNFPLSNIYIRREQNLIRCSPVCVTLKARFSKETNYPALARKEQYVLEVENSIRGRKSGRPIYFILFRRKAYPSGKHAVFLEFVMRTRIPRLQNGFFNKLASRQ